MLNVPSVSVKIELASLVAARMIGKGETGAVSFDAKVKLEERERKSKMVVVGFNLLLTTKPGIVKFEIEGTATLTGKDEEIRKVLEVDPETKVPYVLRRIYQHAFMAMYLMSTMLNVPPPPQDLLYPTEQGGLPEGVSVEVGAEKAEGAEGVTIMADTRTKEPSEATATNK